MKKSTIVILHIIYWVVILFILFTVTFVIAQLTNPQINFAKWIAIWIPIVILPGTISFYTFYFYLFNSFLSRKKIGRLVFYGLLIGIGISISSVLLLSVSKGLSFPYDSISEWLALFLLIFIGVVLNGVIGIILRVFITWYKEIFLKEQLKQKNVEMELALIKLQIDPHFLFNTLSNIDVLISKDANKASAYLNKLSDMMRFMLYENKTDTITLKEEIRYIENYITLQKLRSSNPNYVRFEVIGNLMDKKIASMIFMPFIENAFKHAINRKMEHSIDIRLELKEALIFTCSNYCSKNVQDTKQDGGLGIALIEKRLNLIYPNQFELVMNKEKGTFTVQLKLFI